MLKVFVLANEMVLETCLLFGYTDDARERWSIIMESKEIIYVIVIECCCVCVIFCRCSPTFYCRYNDFVICFQFLTFFDLIAVV